MTESKDSSKFIFYYHDQCPFAQRTWIALLEKEDNPHKPVLFEYRFVNKELADHPHTKAFLAIPGGPATVPTATHDGRHLWESLLVNEYVEGTFNQNRPLLPTTAFGKYKVRLISDKFAPKLQEANFGHIRATDDESREKGKAAILSVFRDLSKAIEGPYAIGEQFTLADIAFFTIIERITLKVAIPDGEDYATLRKWWDLVAARESVKITRRDRTPESFDYFPNFKARTRVEYLKEAEQALKDRLAKLAASGVKH